MGSWYDFEGCWLHLGLSLESNVKLLESKLTIISISIIPSGSNIISIISIIRRWNQEPVRLRLCGINWHISELSGPHYDFQQLPLWHSSWSKETKGSLIFGHRWSNVSPIQPEIPCWLTSWLAMGENPWSTWKFSCQLLNRCLYIYIIYNMMIHDVHPPKNMV